MTTEAESASEARSRAKPGEEGWDGSAGPGPQEFLEKLEAAHEFPGPYTFKLFGPNSPEFEGAAAEVIARHLPGVTPEFSARVSGKANHQCLTVVLDVASARMVMALYADFHEIQGLKMLM